MASRSNALAELTRLWLQERHGCLVRESVPVRVKRGTSDIDFVALHPAGAAWGAPLIPPAVRAIIETKDEHDYDPSGREFARMLVKDAATIGDGSFAPVGAQLKFSMLREEHYRVAEGLFGSNDFARIFIIHDLDRACCAEALDGMRAQGIFWLTAREIVADLIDWYPICANKPALRHTLAGDMLHLLVGYCKLRPPLEAP
jgi:hypothetical protein